MKKSFLILILLILMFPAIAFSTPYSIVSVDSDEVGSILMGGMEVTIGWHDGNSEKFTWASTGVGGVSGTGASGEEWSLNFNGSNTSTLALDWKLTTSDAIDSFTINTIPGNVFFDIIYDLSSADTPGSDNGFWGPNFESADNASATSGTFGPKISFDKAYPDDQVPYGAEFDWAFSNPGYLSTSSSFQDPANNPHDLFSKLLIDFTNPSGFTGVFNFGVDTDKVTGVNPVPEPATMLLFGIGLLGITGIGRKNS